MLATRVIPCLLLSDGLLVKTKKFASPQYIGEPVNTARIFNELEADELIVLDIRASIEGTDPDFELLAQLVDECFMPFTYGGGVRTIEAAERLLTLGMEKVVVNSAALSNLSLLTEMANAFGSQSVVGSLDVISGWLGKYKVHSRTAVKPPVSDPVEWTKCLEDAGAGEIFLNNVSRDGTWEGFDTDLASKITSSVSVPVIVSGGAGSLDHIGEVVHEGGASAVALGSMVVYQKKGFGVLVNFPDQRALSKVLQPSSKP
ncbi:MAG: AglZ/HisF2 family acetamidino modification protein [Magnetovibrionaceae bacterium]